MNEMDITFSRFNHSESHTIESYCSTCEHLAAAALLGDSQVLQSVHRMLERHGLKGFLVDNSVAKS